MLEYFVVLRQEILQETAPHLVDTICAYRAGYIAEVRFLTWLRTVESSSLVNLFPGNLLKQVFFMLL